MTDQPVKRSEYARAEARRGFYIHLIAYVLVNLLLAGINLSSASDSYWFLWVVGGWGIGIFFHALAVFFPGPKPTQS